MPKKKSIKKIKATSSPKVKPLSKELPISEPKRRSTKSLLLFLTLIFVLLAIMVSYKDFFKTSSGKTKSQGLCINNETQAREALEKLPEVKKYYSSIKNDPDNPFIQIDAFFGKTHETKIGYAYVGKQSENNSKRVFAKYLFVSGCNTQFQKQKIYKDKTITPIYFTYDYKIAEKNFVDETKSCIYKLSKATQADFNHDGNLEYLFGCFTGTGNTVDYNLYNIHEGKVEFIQDFKSISNYEEFNDYNHDGYYDISTSGILMDEGECKNDDCFAPFHPGQQGRTLLLRSYHRIWNPKTGKFDPPIKAEVYYKNNSNKIIIK